MYELAVQCRNFLSYIATQDVGERFCFCCYLWVFENLITAAKPPRSINDLLSTPPCSCSFLGVALLCPCTQNPLRTEGHILQPWNVVCSPYRAEFLSRNSSRSLHPLPRGIPHSMTALGYKGNSLPKLGATLESIGLQSPWDTCRFSCDCLSVKPLPLPYPSLCLFLSPLPSKSPALKPQSE